MPGSKLSMTEHDPHEKLPSVQDQRAKREMIEQHGDKNQKERYYAGLLPEEELLAVARRVLFAPMSQFRRYSKIVERDIKHDDTCGVGAPVQFFTREVADGISGQEWHDYRKLHDVVTASWQEMPSGTHAVVTIVEHVGHCLDCNHRETVRRAAGVRITWAGHELVREYALGGD